MKIAVADPMPTVKATIARSATPLAPRHDRHADRITAVPPRRFSHVGRVLPCQTRLSGGSIEQDPPHRSKLKDVSDVLQSLTSEAARPGSTTVIDCAAYCGGVRVADVGIGQIRGALEETR